MVYTCISFMSGLLTVFTRNIPFLQGIFVFLYLTAIFCIFRFLTYLLYHRY